MGEIFEDYTIPLIDTKGYTSIEKREFNPELSFFTNLALDLVDFRDRIRPAAKNIALLDASSKYQRLSATEVRR
jgi:hypothetical protein